MDDDVAEIEEHPAALLLTFAVARLVTRFLELVFEPFGDSAKLQGRARGRKHEVVGEA